MVCLDALINSREPAFPVKCAASIGFKSVRASDRGVRFMSFLPSAILTSATLMLHAYSLG